MAQYRVLIVDDSVVIRGLLASVLGTDPSIRIVGSAGSAEEAADILTRQVVDVVTLDVEMPGTSGLQFLPALRRLNIPTILLSSQAIEGSELRGAALVLGAAACFNKAKVVRDAALLVGLVKAAARHQVQLDRSDSDALEQAKQKACVAARALGVRAAWQESQPAA